MLTASCTPQGSQPGHAEASAACPSGAHPILSDLAGSSERDSRGAGSISELQCARHADCSVDGSQQQQHQVCQHHHQHEGWEEAQQQQQQQQQQQRAGREEEQQQQQQQQEQHEGREEEQQQQQGREEEQQQQHQQQQQQQHQQQQQQQQQRQPDFDPEQEILSPSWQERMKKKRARLLNRLQREAPQAAGLASEVSFRLVGEKCDAAVLRYVFREESWPSIDKLFPVLEAAARASAGSTVATKGASDRPRPAACRQQKAGEQPRQQASFAAPGGAAPAGASRLAAGGAPGTHAGPSAPKRGRPPSSDKDSRERKKKRVDDCRKRMRDYVQQHAPETIPLFDRKVIIRYVGADPRPVFDDKTFLRKADLVAALKAALQHQGREAGAAAGGGAAGARPTAAHAGSRSRLAAASGLAANEIEAAAVADYQDLRAGELLEAFNQLPPECGGPDQPKNTHDKLWLWQRLLKARGIDSQRAKELARCMQERAATRHFEPLERPPQRNTSAEASMQRAARQPAASTPLPRAPGQAGTSAQRRAPTGWALVGPQQEEATAAAEAAHLRRLLREERKRRAAAERLTKELEAQLQAAQQGTAAEEQPPARAADDSADAEAEAGPSADEAAAKGVGLASLLLLCAEQTKARAARLEAELDSTVAAAEAAAAAREVAERESAQLTAQLLTANAAAAAAQEEAQAAAEGAACLLRRAELAEQRAAVAAAAETAAKDEAARLLERLQEEVAGHAETRRQAAAEKAEAIKQMRQVQAAAVHQVKAAAEAAQAARAEREQAAQRQAAEAEHRLQLQQVQQEAAVQKARMEGHESGMTTCSQLLQPLLQQVLGAMSAPNAQQTLAAVPGAHAAGAAAQQDQHAQRGQHLLQQVLAQFQREQGRRVWQPWSQQAAQQGQQAAQRAVPVGQPGPAGWQVPAAQP